MGKIEIEEPETLTTSQQTKPVGYPPEPYN